MVQFLMLSSLFDRLPPGLGVFSGIFVFAAKISR
jgi:hypothetical protein